MVFYNFRKCDFRPMSDVSDLLISFVEISVLYFILFLSFIVDFIG